MLQTSPLRPLPYRNSTTIAVETINYDLEETKRMRFTKMQGIGNDYIYVDCFSQTPPADPNGLSIRISDRHFGIGADGLILIRPPHDSKNDARMQMFNADGSESEMCGNGVRCVAKFVYDAGIARKDNLLIETGRGPLNIQVEVDAGKVRRARVNMAQPILKSAEIPTTLAGDPPIEVPFEVADQTFKGTCVSMGNPHVVIYVDQITDELVLGMGPKIEVAPEFPKKVNVHFVRVISRDEIQMRVWERGSGETLACGTGACAVCVAGVLTGRTNRRIIAHLAGGDLELEWSEQDNCVYKTGPAVAVFDGDFDLPDDVQ